MSSTLPKDDMNTRKKWRALMETPALTLVPGVYDALSARIAEAEGFEAVSVGGYATVGTLLAEADGGQSNVRDYADSYARICDAVEIPVYVDADTGFGGAHNVRQMVRLFERAGVAGLFISDQVFPNRCGYMPGKDVVSAEEMLTRLNAALDARTDPDLYIVARTDAKQVLGADAALERCLMALDTGVDMVKPHGFDSAEEIKHSMSILPPPYMATLSHAAEAWTVGIDELGSLGVTAITFPSATLFAAAGSVQRTLRGLKQDRSFDAVDHELIPLDAYYDLVRLDDFVSNERRWVDKAEVITAKREQA